MEVDNEELEKKKKYMFAILDRFNRDAVYKNIGVELDFETYGESFCATLYETLEEISNSKLATCELMFNDYKDTIVNCSDIRIRPRYRGLLEKPHTTKAVVVDGKCSLLFSACSQAIPSDKTERRSLRKIIETLIERCPEMIKLPFSPPEGERCGPTPLHLMVVKEANTKLEKEFKHQLIEKMLKSITTETFEDDLDLNKFNLKGDMARGSLLRGKTLLNIAVRTLDIKTMELLLSPVKRGEKSPLCSDSYNERKDNMYHSLIRYTAFFPEKEREVISVMMKIEGILKKEKTSTIDPWKQKRPHSLWRMKNTDNLTPLQLAAKLGRFELFNHILNNKVYRLNVGDRGHFDDDSYDVTEIETIPVSTDATKRTKEDKTEGITRDKVDHISALHLLETFVSSKTNARFVSLNVVAKLITSKWNVYKKWIGLWAVIHLIVMALFSWQAVVRSRLKNPIASQTASIPEYNNVALVISANTITTLYGITCLILQSLYYYFYCYRHRKSLPFAAYGHVFSLFSVGVILDYFLMLFEASYDNFILPFILILGWYLFLYFLHVVEHLSFFTILIKDVVKHLFQFGSVMSILLVGFSTAMFVVMQNAEDIEEDTFENIEKTMVKMFTIMLGLGDLDVLFKSTQPILAIIVFVLFVLLTTILLLNALIAIMSNTCSSLTDEASKKAYVRLQRMYTIIHLESMLPNRFLFTPSEQVSQISHNKPGETMERRILSLRPEDEDNNLDPREENTAGKILKFVVSYANKTNKNRKTKPDLDGGKSKEKGTNTQEMAPGTLQGSLEIYETKEIIQ